MVVLTSNEIFLHMSIRHPVRGLCTVRVTVSANPLTHVTRGQYIPKVVIGRLLQIGQTAQRRENVRGIRWLNSHRNM